MTTALTIIGLQSVFFWVFAKIVAIQKAMFPDALFIKIRPLFTLERCLLFGGSLIAIGAGTAIYALLYWYNLFRFGKVEGEPLIKNVCAANFLFGVGFQFVFASFLIYLLDQQINNSPILSPIDFLDHAGAGNKAIAHDREALLPDTVRHQ
jgi:hypothetical protein